MAAATYTISYTVGGTQDAKAQSLLTAAGGPMSAATNHIFAVASPKSFPAPAGGRVTITVHQLDYLSFDNWIIADDLMDRSPVWHIKNTRMTVFC